MESIGPQNLTDLLVGPFPDVFSLALEARWHQHSDYSRYHLTLSHYLFSLCGFISILWGQQGRNSTHLLSILSAKRKGRRVSSHLVQWTRTESHWSDCVHLCASHFHQGNELWLPRLGPLAHPGSWRRGWSALPWAPRWGGGGMLR